MSAWDSRTCDETELLLAERASGPLEPAEAAALERHLEVCARCRAAAGRFQALLSLVALPPAGPREEAALRDLPERTLAAWGRQQGERRAIRAVAAVAGLIIAAAIPLAIWRNGVSTAAAVAASAADVDLAELAWDASLWDLTEPGPAVEPAEQAAVLDALAIEGDGAFPLGDSG
jgi:anti-sigma factor RsiW